MEKILAKIAECEKVFGLKKTTEIIEENCATFLCMTSKESNKIFVPRWSERYDSFVECSIQHEFSHFFLGEKIDPCFVNAIGKVAYNENKEKMAKFQFTGTIARLFDVWIDEVANDFYPNHVFVSLKSSEIELIRLAATGFDMAKVADNIVLFLAQCMRHGYDTRIRQKLMECIPVRMHERFRKIRNTLAELPKLPLENKLACLGLYEKNLNSLIKSYGESFEIRLEPSEDGYVIAV